MRIRKIIVTSITLLFVVSFFSALFDPSGSLHAQTNAAHLQYTSIDVMKWTKDTVRNQPTDSEIEGIVSTIMNSIHPAYIAISIPMDATGDFGSNNQPAPRTIEALTQKWSDVIHAHGAKVLWRGTWSGIEGIYNFPKLVGSSRFPAGTAASAPTDGNSTWLGKTYTYIVNHPTYFANGDIWAPMPERTEGIFSDSTSFLPADGAGLQANYANFFNSVKTVSDVAFARISKQPITGMTTNNFTEINSGWLLQSVLDTAGYIVIDHYGLNHTVQEMNSDLRKIYSERHKPIFIQEWGDYWNSTMSVADRTVYLQNMYAMYQQLINEGILVGFNYWGAWGNPYEGILDYNGTTFQVNYRGQLVAQFFNTQAQQQQQPQPPQPAPDPQAPTITIASPLSNGTIAPGAIAILATANDNVGVAGVQFKVDGQNVGVEDTSSPYGIAWNATVGVHTISAIARDAAGNRTTASSVTVTIQLVQPPQQPAPDTQAPTVAITAPPQGVSLPEGIVAISASAGDNTGVAGVQFKIDGQNIGSEDVNTPYGMNWNATAGSHIATAVARDAAGNSTVSQPIAITITGSSSPTTPTTTPSAPTTPTSTSPATPTTPPPPTSGGSRGQQKNPPKKNDNPKKSSIAPQPGANPSAVPSVVPQYADGFNQFAVTPTDNQISISNGNERVQVQGFEFVSQGNTLQEKIIRFVYTFKAPILAVCDFLIALIVLFLIAKLPHAYRKYFVGSRKAKQGISLLSR